MYGIKLKVSYTSFLKDALMYEKFTWNLQALKIHRSGSSSTRLRAMEEATFLRQKECFQKMCWNVFHWNKHSVHVMCVKTYYMTLKWMTSKIKLLIRLSESGRHVVRERSRNHRWFYSGKQKVSRLLEISTLNSSMCDFKVKYRHEVSEWWNRK